MDTYPGFKTHFAQRNHHPLKEPKFLHLQASLVLKESARPQTSIVLGESGRRNFAPRYATTEDFQPAKRQLFHPSHHDERPQGKRYIPHPSSEGLELSHNERVHFDIDRSLELDNGLPTSNWRRKKTVLTPTGTPASRREAEGYKLEASMNRKQRVGSQALKRNNIPTATNGDNSYKEADHEPGFYAKGGLVVGSTNILKKSAKPTIKRKDDALTESTGRKLEASYAKLQQRLAADYDHAQVLSLTVSSINKQQETVPSWEEKTGNFLVIPDDESVY